jgi:hypothetical protein
MKYPKDMLSKIGKCEVSDSVWINIQSKIKRRKNQLTPKQLVAASVFLVLFCSFNVFIISNELKEIKKNEKDSIGFSILESNELY